LKLLLATNNPGKVREVAEILALPGLELVSPADLGQRFEASEDGETFEANARTKARAAFRQFAMAVVADDSGLEIDALDGKPGVHSARFLDRAGYAEKCQEILRLMSGVPDPKRRARFRCCAVLVEADGSEHTFEGVCPGTIARAARGAGGFGYDPVFVPDGFEQTFAELGAETKNRISHRARAFSQVRDFLARGGLGNRDTNTTARRTLGE
jgi:XTP/dITP diphosphohydrolase